jgi:hypothetical protein
MIVREAYREIDHSVCRRHLDMSADVLGVALGPVQSSRSSVCEWCSAEDAARQHSQTGRPIADLLDAALGWPVDDEQKERLLAFARGVAAKLPKAMVRRYRVLIRTAGSSEYRPLVGWDTPWETRGEAEQCAARALRNDGWSDARVVEVDVEVGS